MLKTHFALTTAACLAILGGEANAGFVVNIDVPDTRGDSDAGVPTINDFITQNPASGIVATDAFLNSGDPNGNSNGAGWTDLATATSIGGYTIQTTGGSNGWNAGDSAHTDLNPIAEGYGYGMQGGTLTISNILANSSAGDDLILSLWGIGDNLNQASSFSVVYNGAAVVQDTAYNGGGARSDATGSVPFVNFVFTADGVTDSIVVTVNADTASGGDAVVNGFTFTAVPEPGSLALLGMGGLLIARRRRG